MESILSVTLVFFLAIVMILAFVLVRNYHNMIDIEHRMHEKPRIHHPHTNTETRI